MRTMTATTITQRSPGGDGTMNRGSRATRVRGRCPQPREFRDNELRHRECTGATAMRVLLAFDGSDDARAAAESLAEFPLPKPTTLLIVSVVTLPHAALDIPQVREFNDALRRDAQRIVDDARAWLTPRFGEAEGWVREGDPRTEIIAAAELWKPDLIVVGARGLSAFKGFLLGSVSTTVVRQAACPVLVVKRTISPLR